MEVLLLEPVSPSEATPAVRGGMYRVTTPVVASHTVTNPKANVDDLFLTVIVKDIMRSDKKYSVVGGGGYAM